MWQRESTTACGIDAGAEATALPSGSASVVLLYVDKYGQCRAAQPPGEEVDSFGLHVTHVSNVICIVLPS